MPLVRNPRMLRALLLAAGSAAAVAGSVYPSLGADLAPASIGTLVMEQSVPGNAATTCRSSEGSTGTRATCSAVNLYGGSAGGPLVPGGEIHSTEVTITNAGTQSAHGFTIVAGPCDSAPAPGSRYSGDGDLCDQLRVRITPRGSDSVLFDGTAASLASKVVDLLSGTGQRGPVSPGSHRAYTFEVWLETTAADASYQGLEVTQSLSWRFSA